MRVFAWIRMDELAVFTLDFWKCFFEFKSIEEVFEIRLDGFYNYVVVNTPTPLLFLLSGIGG